MRERLEVWERHNGFRVVPRQGRKIRRARNGATPGRRAGSRKIVLNQSRWAARLPTSEANMVDTFSEAITKAIPHETTVTRERLSVDLYEQMGGNLDGTPLQRSRKSRN